MNADVPGGFIEAGAVTRIVASYLPQFTCPPDPARDLAQAVASRAASGDVALVHATSYSDDQQVMRQIGAAIGSLGIGAHFAAPDHLRVAGARLHQWCTRQSVSGDEERRAAIAT